MRFLSGRAIQLTHNFYDDTSESALDLNSATVTVTNDLGVAVVTNAAATEVGTTWNYSLAAQPLGVYTVVWNGNNGAYLDNDEFEVVGAVAFSIKEARDSDEDLDATRFPAAKVRLYRDIVEAEFERITGRSFTPRVRVINAVGDGTTTLLTGLYDIQAVLAVNGSTTDAATWSVTATGLVESPTEIAEGTTVKLKLKYGFSAIPADVQRAALTRLRHFLVAERSAIPERATGFNTADGGYFQLATAGRSGFETGLPDVDAILKRYTYSVIQSVMGGAN